VTSCVYDRSLLDAPNSGSSGLAKRNGAAAGHQVAGASSGGSAGEDAIGNAGSGDTSSGMPEQGGGDGAAGMAAAGESRGGAGSGAMSAAGSAGASNVGLAEGLTSSVHGSAGVGASSLGGAEAGASGSRSASSGCAPLLAPVDVAHGAHVVGTGTAQSCSEAALRDALALGGVVRFDCGGAATITLGAQLDLRTDIDTTIDGGSEITLDGRGVTRILRFWDADYRTSRVTVTLQHIALRNGKSSGTPIPSAPAPCSQGIDKDGSGSAIIVRNGVLHVIDATFEDNQAPDRGPDVGGAIYALGSLEVLVQGGTFRNNSGANGGAIYVLGSELNVVDSSFSANRALGTGANHVDSACTVNGGQSGDGGNGAAININGGDNGDVLLCGVTFTGNEAHALGGAVFRTPNVAKQTTTLDRCSFDLNSALQAGKGGGGALYFHNSKLVIRASTFSSNDADQAGAIQADGTTLDLSNATFSSNTARSGLGGAIALFGDGGTLVNCTFAGNKAEGGSGLFGAAIAGNTVLTIRNTIFAGNTTQDCAAPMACADGASTGAGDIQWPAAHTVCADKDTPCTSSAKFADPKLGQLTDNGGPTLTHIPGESSPALGAGSDCPATDQRGKPRPPSGCTAGAVEP
jgi:predicted outer membrane repeat protein